MPFNFLLFLKNKIFENQELKFFPSIFSRILSNSFRLIKYCLYGDEIIKISSLCAIFRSNFLSKFLISEHSFNFSNSSKNEENCVCSETVFMSLGEYEISSQTVMSSITLIPSLVNNSLKSAGKYPAYIRLGLPSDDFQFGSV